MSFFPHAKLASPSLSSESYPWFDVLGASQQCDPRIVLALFEKLVAVSKEVYEKFRKAADNKKKTSSALLTWGDVYHLSDYPKFDKTQKLNESFSCLREKTLSNSHSIALSLDET